MALLFLCFKGLRRIVQCLVSISNLFFQASGVEESEIPDDIKLIGFAQLSIS